MLGVCVYQSFFAMRCCAWIIPSVSVVLILDSQYFWWNSRMIVGLYRLWRRQCSCCGQWFYYLHLRLPYICYFISYYYYWWWGSVVCHIYFKHWIVLNFTPLFVTTSPGVVETYCLQTVVAAAVGVVSQNLLGVASRIAIFWFYLLRSIPYLNLSHLAAICVALPCLIPGWHTCVICHVGCWACGR